MSEGKPGMKIALIGYGKMGKLVEKCASEAGHEIVAKIAPSLSNRITAQNIADADVSIDFTAPDAVLENVRLLASLKKNIVIGTTGWEKEHATVAKIVADEGIGLLYDANFSMGMHCFLQLVQEAARLFFSVEGYDVAGIESHHLQKRDAPSGTAKMIAAKMEEASGVRVPFTSVRCGSIPGTHTLIFDSPVDTVTLTHNARSREGFARGALAAAEWIKGRVGVYTLSDLIEEKRLCSR